MFGKKKKASSVKKKPRVTKGAARKGTKTLAKKSASAKKSTPATKKKTTAKKKGAGIKATVKRKSSGKKTSPKKKTSATKTSPLKTTAKKSKTTARKKPTASLKLKTAARAKSASRPKAKKRATAKPAAVKSRATKASPSKMGVKKTQVARKTRSSKTISKKTTHRPPVKPPFEAYRGIRSYLFSSYAHKNMKTVFNILKKLHDDRYRIWYDEGIEPGNEWPEVVGTAIIDCTQFIVFMSPAAALSRNVRNEVNLAFTENKDIIVIFLQKTSLSSGMKLQIGTVQFINQYELSDKKFYEKLTKVLNSSQKN